MIDVISVIILTAASRLMTKPTTPLKIHHHTCGYVRAVKYQISQAHCLVVLSKLYQTPLSRSSICLMICCVNHCNQPPQSQIAHILGSQNQRKPQSILPQAERDQHLQKLKVLNFNCNSIRSQHNSGLFKAKVEDVKPHNHRN